MMVLGKAGCPADSESRQVIRVVNDRGCCHICFFFSLKPLWVLANDAKRRAAPQVPDQVTDVAKVARQQRLLLFRRQDRGAAAVGAAPPLGSAVSAKGLGQLARTALQQGGHRRALAELGARDGGGFGHEIKVEELHELDLEISAGGAGLEQGRDGQEAVEALKCASVLGRVDQGCNEDKDGGLLDGWAVAGLQEVEE